MFDTWDNADRVYAGLTEVDALKKHDGGSSFAGTLLHITALMDFHINARVRSKEMHPLFARQYQQFWQTGQADDWPGILAAVKEVRASLRAYLEPLTDADLERIKFPPTYQWPEATLRYILYRGVTHNYFHIGEVAAKRDKLGHKVGEYPGPLADAM